MEMPLPPMSVTTLPMIKSSCVHDTKSNPVAAIWVNRFRSKRMWWALRAEAQKRMPVLISQDPPSQNGTTDSHRERGLRLKPVREPRLLVGALDPGARHRGAGPRGQAAQRQAGTQPAPATSKSGCTLAGPNGAPAHLGLVALTLVGLLVLGRAARKK